ncbi:MAG TPA: ABC transporter permease subunit [Candidatus Marinimicrobia bacterium]|nr:ABC transporter permease subunit [Candidatus Neomarinimicrobiota bacterium]
MTQQIIKSESINHKRWRKFKSLKRGYYSFILIITLYILSLFLPLFINSKALVVQYEGDYYFPAFSEVIPWVSTYYDGNMFGQDIPGAANFRQLQKSWDDSDNWLIMPIYPFNPFEDITNNENRMYEPPSTTHWLGTDNTGRDVLARMCYAFNISISFAFVLTVLNFIIGISIGGAMGYFGGKFDLFFQRFIEIWSSLPLLFVVIIISSIIQPSFALLIFIYTMVNWIFLTYYMRAEFYREKSKDYVSAAISMGQSNTKIIFKHILPNSLIPVITYFPFSMVGGILVLVSLDFLGFGLPPPTPSWGQILYVGLSNITKWWMVFSPIMAQFFTLLCIVFIGEGLREAFDPKIYSRLR